MADLLDLIRDYAPRGDHAPSDQDHIFLHSARPRLAGKVAVVTEADSDVGRAVAALLAREGAAIVVAYADAHEAALQTEQAVQTQGSESMAFAGDLSDNAICDRLVQRAMAAFGRIDMILTLFGKRQMANWSTALTDYQRQRTIEAVANSALFLGQAAVPYLRPGARIIQCLTVREADEGSLVHARFREAIGRSTHMLGKALEPNDVGVHAVMIRERSAGADQVAKSLLSLVHGIMSDRRAASPSSASPS